MNKLIQVFIVAVSFSLMSGSASGEVTDIRKQIKLCHEVSDSLKRLTCYDSLTKDSLTQAIEFKAILFLLLLPSKFWPLSCYYWIRG